MEIANGPEFDLRLLTPITIPDNQIKTSPRKDSRIVEVLIAKIPYYRLSFHLRGVPPETLPSFIIGRHNLNNKIYASDIVLMPNRCKFTHRG